MTVTADPLPGVMCEADTQGDLVEPVALLRALEEIESPVNALSDNDQANALFAALDTDFGFIRFTRATKNPLQSGDQTRWASLIRWLVRELKEWRRNDDPANRKLVAIFVVAQASDWDNGLWGLMPDEISCNSELIQQLKALVGSLAATFTARGRAEPIWEREAVEKFKVADEQEDWVAISRGLAAFEHQIFPNTILMQSVRCLHRCGVDHLVEALANVHQTVVAAQVASSLSIHQRLGLAAKSDNPYVQFGCLYWTLSARAAARQFSADEGRVLTALLLKVADDGARWTAWMCVFNAYPIRYPALQSSLGRALAEAPSAAVEAYVSAVVLNPKEIKPDEGRRAVADCLRAFRAKADPERRALLWKLAHDRWLAWHFDQGNPHTNLLAISWSDLDYAVVGYAIETMSESDRVEARDALLGELQVLDDQWHASITDIVSSWNRLLSQFQPYAHASTAIANGEDWLPETKTYRPFDLTSDHYLMMKFRLI